MSGNCNLTFLFGKTIIYPANRRSSPFIRQGRSVSLLPRDSFGSVPITNSKTPPFMKSA